jgi:hypothetical protein
MAIPNARFGFTCHSHPCADSHKVGDLTANVIRQWHAALAGAPARLRTRRQRKGRTSATSISRIPMPCGNSGDPPTASWACSRPRSNSRSGRDMRVADRTIRGHVPLQDPSWGRARRFGSILSPAENPSLTGISLPTSRSDARRSCGRVGIQPGDGLTPQSGCPAGSASQNMILSK